MQGVLAAADMSFAFNRTSFGGHFRNNPSAVGPWRISFQLEFQRLIA